MEISPVEQVEQVVDNCLQSSQKENKDSNFIFSRWTIMDYSKAYNSGEVTPTMVWHCVKYTKEIESYFLVLDLWEIWITCCFSQVAERLIAAVEESSSSSGGVSQPMSFFINFDSRDILRQANESTIRYQRGTL